MAISIVGTWNVFIDWDSSGKPVASPYPITFHADGTWTYVYGGGRWIQVEGMFFLNANGSAGLVYTANVTKDALAGVMGFATSSPSSGNWWATKPGAPALTAAAVDTSEEVDDPMLGPAHKKP
jgi:hypothetical protein